MRKAASAAPKTQIGIPLGPLDPAGVPVVPGGTTAGANWIDSSTGPPEATNVPNAGDARNAVPFAVRAVVWTPNV